MKTPHLGPTKVLYAGMGNLTLIGMFWQNHDILEGFSDLCPNLQKAIDSDHDE